MLESLAGQTFLILHLLFSSALQWDKRKNKTILTELPILTQRLRPRTLDPVTRARILGGPNFFIFFTKGCDGRLQTDTVFIFFYLKLAAGPFTAGFGFKTGSDIFYHSRLLKPTQKAQFTIGF